MSPGGLIKERAWQETLIEGFERFGYLVNHVYPLRTEHGWRTSTTLKGWPDLTAIGKAHTVFVEVKGEKTPVEQAQLDVLELLAGTPGHRCWILRPCDNAGMQEIVRWMVYPAQAPVRWGFYERPGHKAGLSHPWPVPGPTVDRMHLQPQLEGTAR